MTEALLDKILRQHDSPRIRENILEIVNATGVRENDPVFLLLVGTGKLQGMLETGPDQIKQTFEYAHQQILGSLEDYEQAARRGVENQVAQMAKDAIAKAGKSKAQITAQALIGGGIAALLLIAMGAAMGLAWFKTTTRLAPGGPVQLSVEEASALEWAISQEGQYARQIVTWNEDLLGGECQAQIQQFIDQEGLTIQYGARKARRGICLLWIVPPEKREYF